MDKHVEINHKMYATSDALYDVPQVALVILGIHESNSISVLNKGLGPRAWSIFVVEGQPCYLDKQTAQHTWRPNPKPMG